MNQIQFHVTGEPIAQPRPRARAIPQGPGKRWIATIYNPADADGWKSCVAEAARRYIGREIIDEPVAVTVTFWMPRPANHYGTGRNADTLKASAPTFCTTRPDVDNLVKAVFDALTTLGIWRDDCIVVRTAIEKRYANGDPGADVTIGPLVHQQAVFPPALV